MIRPKIISIGSYIPNLRINNFTQANKFGDGEAFVTNKLGFESLSIKDSNENILNMCYKAFSELKSNLQDFDSSLIDILVLVTQNPLELIPHNSAILHSMLKLTENCMTFDISQGCAGYTHGIEIVNSLLRTGKFRNALLFTCDPYSQIINREDRNTSMIFGDAATVSLISSNSNVGYEIIDSNLGTLPNEHDCLKIESNYLRMDGKRVFNNAINIVPKSINEILTKNNLNKEDIDKYILHPGSKFIVNSIAKKMNLNTESYIEFTCGDYGNTVSSSIPLMLKKRLDEKVNSLEKKTNIIISGFGVGFSWGTCLLRRTN